MALRDVKDYFYSLQTSYLNMKELVEQLDAELKAGNVQECQVEQSRILLQAIKTNYDRLAYVLFLFEKPNRQSKAKKYANNTSNKALESYFKKNNATKEDILKENEEALTKLRELVKGINK